MPERRELAYRRAVAMLDELRDIIQDADDLNIGEAAAAAGVAQSSFYRWLDQAPKKIDLASVAALADYLHETQRTDDFAALWRRVCRTVK